MAEPFNVTLWHRRSLCTCSSAFCNASGMWWEVPGWQRWAGNRGRTPGCAQPWLSMALPSPQPPLGLPAKSQLLSGVSGSFCGVDGCL